MVRKVLVALLVFAVAFGSFGASSDAQMHKLEKGSAKKNLYQMLSKAPEVKVYLEPITDSSAGQADGMVEALGNALRKAATNRLSINFVEVTDPQDADLVVTCDIQERIWMEVDPIDEVYGIGGIAKDIALQENYARMEAYFTIRRGPNKQLFKRIRGLKRFRTMWGDEVKATITQGDMPEEQSKKMIINKLAYNFIKEAFGKRSKMVKNKQDRRFAK